MEINFTLQPIFNYDFVLPTADCDIFITHIFQLFVTFAHYHNYFSTSNIAFKRLEDISCDEEFYTKQLILILYYTTGT